VLEVLRGINQPTVHHLFGFMAGTALVAYGMLGWAPAYYRRTFNMSIEEVGFWLGIAVGLGTLVGALLGGFAANRSASRGPVWGLKLALWTAALNAPLTVLAFVVDSKTVSLSLMLMATITGAVGVGPLYAALQTLTEARVRATAIAILGVFVVIAGQGIGPALVGAVSDLTRSMAGEASLRWSLVAITMLGFWPLYHAWRLVVLYPAARFPDDEAALASPS
jgi:MFS family permease